MTMQVPEAPASASVRCSIEGFEWLITIRGFEVDGTAGRQLLSKIKAVNATLAKMGAKPIFGKNGPPKTAAPAPTAEPDEEHPLQKPCPIHGVMMDRRESKHGGYFYSHALGKDADGKTMWCNGKE